MESLKRVCPTEVLIDLSEDASSSHMDSKITNAASDYYKSQMPVNNKGNALFDCATEVLVDVLSASNFCLEQHFASDNTQLDCKPENLNDCKSGIRDCPTALLVDVPSTSNTCLKQHLETDYAELHHKQEKLNVCKSGVQELNKGIYNNFDVGTCSEEDSVGHSPQLNYTSDEVETQRLRWRTPSPKSMSRISKEASKVICTLNSSEIFDEDSLLTEEMFPIPINYETFGLEDITEQESISETENKCENEILNTSVSVQTENVVIINAKETEVYNKTDIPDPETFTACKKFQDCPKKQSLETVSSESSKEPDCSSVESSEIYGDSLNKSTFSTTSDGMDDVFTVKQFSSEIYGDSLSKSTFSTINDRMDDVFTAKQFSSEDKENVQRRKHKFLSDDIKNKSKSPCNITFKSKLKSDFRGTLRNLSNISHEITSSTKCSSPNGNKNVITPCRRISMTKTKIIQPSTVKYQDTRELVSSIKKSSLPAKNASSSLDSSCTSSSSDPKQSTVSSKMKTPSRRYSMATPLRSVSAVKPPVTPLCSFQKPPILKYTPQSAGNSHFSFSKSWQQPTVSSHFSNSKIMKHQNYTSIPGSTSASKINTGRLNTLNQRRQSFSQSMSAVSFRSLGKDTLPSSNKSRFCSKLNLPSPLPVGQDKKIVRVLFPSVPRK